MAASKPTGRVPDMRLGHETRRLVRKEGFSPLIVSEPVACRCRSFKPRVHPRPCLGRFLMNWWSHWELNPRPSRCRRDALPLSYDPMREAEKDGYPGIMVEIPRFELGSSRCEREILPLKYIPMVPRCAFRAAPWHKLLVERIGFEPMTPCLQGKCSTN